jgi:hypothetical protein
MNRLKDWNIAHVSSAVGYASDGASTKVFASDWHDAERVPTSGCAHNTLA